jgi:hypothetical protein
VGLAAPGVSRLFPPAISLQHSAFAQTNPCGKLPQAIDSRHSLCSKPDQGVPRNPTAQVSSTRANDRLAQPRPPAISCAWARLAGLVFRNSVKYGKHFIVPRLLAL